MLWAEVLTDDEVTEIRRQQEEGDELGDEILPADEDADPRSIEDDGIVIIEGEDDERATAPGSAAIDA